MAVRAETQVDLTRVDDGTPGVSPTATVTKVGDTATITITDVNQTTTASISDGTDGTNGVSVTSVEPQYYLSTSDTSATGGSWSSTPAVFVSGYFYWTRDYITFSDGTHDTSTEVYNSGMTQAAQDAYDAKTLADDTNQYFWYAPTGADTGAHITEVPQDEWNDSSDPNYHSGGNLLARSTGIAVRDGMTELATFGVSGMVVGETASGKSRTEIGTSGMQVIQNENGTDTQIANIGYGPGIDGGGGTSNAPYYTLGKRTTGSSVGNLSLVAGNDNEASGYNSVALGFATKATGYCSHAEGYGSHSTAQGAHAECTSTLASGKSSHAEGEGTTASGFAAHAEGHATIASGSCSHAGGRWTTAASDYQTVIGIQNIADNANTYALIIGGGQESDPPKNILTVDWSGNVKAAGNLTLENHTSEIGWYNSHNGTTSVANGTSYSSISASAITLSAGRYMLFGSARFAGNASGYRGLCVMKGSSSVGKSQTSQQTLPSSAWTTALNCSMFDAITSSTTYYLGVYQNSGGSLSVTWDFYAVRIR